MFKFSWLWLKWFELLDSCWHSFKHCFLPSRPLMLSSVGRVGVINEKVDKLQGRPLSHSPTPTPPLTSGLSLSSYHYAQQPLRRQPSRCKAFYGSDCGLRARLVISYLSHLILGKLSKHSSELLTESRCHIVWKLILSYTP